MIAVTLPPVVSRRIEFMLTVVGLRSGPAVAYPGAMCRTCGRRFPGPVVAHIATIAHQKRIEVKRALRDARTATRFWSLVDQNGPVPDFAPHLGRCWIWTGPIVETTPGYPYGNARVDIRGERFAHRVAYALKVGPIADGLQLDHLCRVTLCVNPAHLEAVTCRENVHRGLNGVLRPERIVCRNGHSLANKYPNGRCRTCVKDVNDRMTARRRARRLALRVAA